MQISKYQVFAKVVECGSLTKAAEVLNYTQSGISHIVKNLEKEVGVQLLIRSNKEFRLTPEGEQLLETIREIANQEEKLTQLAGEIRGVQTGRIRIGSMCSVSSLWLPYVIHDLFEQYPNIEFEVVDGDYEETEKLLEQDDLDCALLPKPCSKQLSHELLYMDKYYAVIPEHHPWSSMESVPIPYFEGENFIVPTEGMQYRMGDMFRRYNVHPHIRLRAKDDHGTLSMVHAGLGITILSEMLLRCYLLNFDVEVKEIDPAAYRDLGFCLHEGREMSPVTRLFHDYLIEWVRRNVPHHAL